MTTIHSTTEQEGHAPVTVLGLGPMGRALAGAFLAAGHPTTVWNRTAGKDDELVARGALRAASAAEAARAARLIVICVLDYDAVHAVLEPIGTALAGRTLVNLTADAPDRARRTAAWAADRGIGYLDGAIMSPPGTIGEPSAVILYSGDEAVYAAARPVLAGLGGTATHLGGDDPGRAASYDVALLDMFWTAMSGAMHGLALARAEHISATDLAPFARGVLGLLPDIIEEFAGRVDAGRHPAEDSDITSAAAGMAHVRHVTEARGLDVGLIAAAEAMARRAIDAGHGGDGFSRLADTAASDTAA
ncbi:NAD(P)-dependent oxidoreductase [Streptomyces johnsoniae]|uniref:NAD(P)-binding domain-containing protein n=1 Tax=Streptomyces johnsoniae TaxID=3075532 RepID=A0ABU2S0W4_9ACTN|nr:NAD(P)-binding domain-containing protein [Streptomyces sp. DSM 41886]MDT0442585.1 NAD(P)-binding domain-containing protein [Streptomyces sp. DSM 41886]